MFQKTQDLSSQIDKLESDLKLQSKFYSSLLDKLQKLKKLKEQQEQQKDLNSELENEVGI